MTASTAYNNMVYKFTKVRILLLEVKIFQKNALNFLYLSKKYFSQKEKKKCSETIISLIWDEYANCLICYILSQKFVKILTTNKV